MMKQKQKTYHYFIFLIFFLLGTALLHNNSYNAYPSKIHTWAQSDHYVLALGFLDNNFDFFHPKTYSKNHQFPPKGVNKDTNAITAVDFPLLQYSAAILMKIFDSKSPWIYRLLNLLGSFIALFVLFKTFLQLKGFWSALLLISFVMFIPVYSYYQNGFLPSMMAFNVLLIGIAFILKHEALSLKKYWCLGVVFLTLAALMRFTQVIFLIALSGAIFLNILRKKRFDNRIIVILLGLVSVLGYFLHNAYLSNHFGSIFLNKPLLTSNFSAAFAQTFQQAKMYTREIFTLLHVAVLVISWIVFKRQGLLQKIKYSIFGHWLLFSLLGVFIFNILMSWSMSAHDYYSLDTWIPLISMTFILFLSHIDLEPYQKYFSIFSLVIILGMLSYSVEKQYWKYKFIESHAENLINDFYESTAFLDKYLGDSDKVLVIAGNGWNTPMVRWNREVYRMAWKYDEQLPLVKNQNYDYLVTQNRSFEEIVLKNNLDFYDEFQLVADNKKVSIWKSNKQI